MRKRGEPVALFAVSVCAYGGHDLVHDTLELEGELRRKRLRQILYQADCVLRIISMSVGRQ